MILLIGDLHYLPPGTRVSGTGGTGGPGDEAELVRCLDAVSGAVGNVVLLGDVFDAYVEYRHLVPRGPIRLLGQLARLADSGVGVTYVVGNHDPWHRSFVEQDLGFRLLRGPKTIAMDGVLLHLEHGDLPNRSSLGRRLVRHPVSRALYTSLLPGDSGQAFAQRVSRLLGGRREDVGLPGRLRQRAREILSAGEVDVVAMGHSHVPDYLETATGAYMNPGFWPRHRLVGVIEGSAASLCKWANGELLPFEPDATGQETRPSD